LRGIRRRNNVLLLLVCERRNGQVQVREKICLIIHIHIFVNCYLGFLDKGGCTWGTRLGLYVCMFHWPTTSAKALHRGGLMHVMVVIALSPFGVRNGSSFLVIP
jgi:hypothetical protein